MASLALRFAACTRAILAGAIHWIGRHPWRATLALLLSLLLLADQCFPPPIPRAEPGLVVLAADGSPLRSWPAQGGVWRHPVSPQQVSPYYLQALHGYEDRWFDWHPGVNPLALGRAAWQWLSHGEIVSGGSTLTMQVARIIEPQAPGIPGKLRQMARALQLEARLSKADILTLYLNHAPMGGIVEGVEMASRLYLGKPALQLTPAEAALLVALPQAPSLRRPDRFPERARKARDKVLRRMQDLDVWPAALVADALSESVAANPPRARWLAPLAAERLRQAQGRRAQSLIQSTLDVETQATVERMLLDRVDRLPPKVSMAVLVMDSRSLAVRAYAGSADFSDSSRFAHVDMVRGVRSPGSTLKPFLYAQALDEGLIHSESLLADAPQSFAGYEPGNFQADFSGPVSVAEALQRSLNVPAVDLLDRVGPPQFAARLASAGLRLRLPPGGQPNLSIILGGAGSTLEELVGAYRALAAGGMAGKPRLSPDAPLQERPIMSPGAAFIVREILEAGGHPDRPFHEASARIAWKTGTSFGFRDAWAVGVNDHYTIGVWVGRPDGTPNPGFFGANVAAPLLRDILTALPRQTPLARQRPANVSSARICWPLGLAASQTEAAHCHQQRSAWVLDGAIPPTLPDRTRPQGLRERIWVDEHGQRTTPTCSPGAQAREVARWPLALEAWLSAADLQRQGIPAWAPGCMPLSTHGAVKLTGIAPGARIQRAPAQAVALLELAAQGGNGRLLWLLDGSQLAGEHARRLRLPLRSNGTHRITVIDQQGNYDSASFQVSGF